MKKKYDKISMQVLNKLALLADGDLEQSFQSKRAQQALAHFLQVYHPGYYMGEDTLPRKAGKRRKISFEQWMYKHYEWWLALGVIVLVILLWAFYGGK